MVRQVSHVIKDSVSFYLSPLPPLVFSSCLLPPGFPKMSAAAPGNEYSEVQVKGQSQQAPLSVTFPRKSKASSETPLQTLCFLHHNWIPWLLLAARGSGKVSIWQSILGVILGHHMGLAYGHAGKNVGPLARERVGRAASG